jgi:hypothetical protein
VRWRNSLSGSWLDGVMAVAAGLTEGPRFLWTGMSRLPILAPTTRRRPTFRDGVLHSQSPSTHAWRGPAPAPPGHPCAGGMMVLIVEATCHCAPRPSSSSQMPPVSR